VSKSNKEYQREYRNRYKIYKELVKKLFTFFTENEESIPYDKRFEFISGLTSEEKELMSN